MSKGIQTIFSEVPKTYELVNHTLTLGMDILWRKRAVRIAASLGGSRWIDVCSGTGETANYLSRAASNGTSVFATDFSMPMLSYALKKPEASNITFCLSDIKQLPFGDNSFDLVTISFATRNINVSREILVQSFSEFYRVLRPRGCFINLETSQPASPLVRKLFHGYVKLLVKPVGQALSGSRAGYTYLSKTIPRFYPAEELADILRTAGFDEVRYQRLLFGAAAIHQSFKR
jgi:demethylmenaquinone methyltransferase/2-methoxy-6-polyprenyl-1,4-benzoquinol methylase